MSCVSGIQKGRTGTDGGDKGMAFEEEMGRERSAKFWVFASSICNPSLE